MNNIPTDCLLSICNYLTIYDISSLSMVSKKVYNKIFHNDKFIKLLKYKIIKVIYIITDILSICTNKIHSSCINSIDDLSFKKYKSTSYELFDKSMPKWDDSYLYTMISIDYIDKHSIQINNNKIYINYDMISKHIFIFKLLIKIISNRNDIQIDVIAPTFDMIYCQIYERKTLRLSDKFYVTNISDFKSLFDCCSICIDFRTSSDDLSNYKVNILGITFNY
jgi:hypothetical protein